MKFEASLKFYNTTLNHGCPKISENIEASMICKHYRRLSRYYSAIAAFRPRHHPS